MKRLILTYIEIFLELFNHSSLECKLFCLGIIKQRGVEYDLSAYFIDEQGTLYSKNRDSYETDYGTSTLTLSDGSVNKLGKIVNTLRDSKGRKVTLTRESLVNSMIMGLLVKVK
jgi:hypothetical protein